MMDNRFKLKNISLKGFKSFSFDEGVNLPLDDITVLLGANGSGKSNLIAFFQLLAAMLEGNLQNYVARLGTAELFLYYGVKKTRSMEIELKIDQGERTFTYACHLAYAIPDSLIIEGEYVEYDVPPGFSVNCYNVKETVFWKNETNKKVKDLYDFLHGFKLFQFQDTSIESALRLSSHENQTDYLQSNGGNIAAYLYSLRSEYREYYDRIVGYVREIMPQFGDFYLQPNSAGYVMLKWKDNSGNDYIMLPQQISDGTLRFVALATLLLQPAEKLPSLIVLDEPELGLHPSAIIQLAEMIKQASQHTQVILATQSPQLADEFEAENIAIVERNEDLQCTTIHKLDEDRLKEWLEEYTIGELWNKNVIGGKP